MDFVHRKNIPYSPSFWPPESPDLNVIEAVWHEMKQYLKAIYQPKSKEELFEGIRHFWKTRMTVEKCQRYIMHIFRVYPQVIENEGGPTLY